MAGAGDGEAATVFLETSLGTRLVVSFPACATTVADLKRLVSAEHAACFPQAGPIAVTSLQVKHDDALFHLTDSMAVEAAFRWVKGPWRIRVEARALRPRPLAREDGDCGSGDSEPNAGSPVVRDDSAQNISSNAASQGGGNLAIGDGFGGTPLMGRLGEPLEGVESAPDQLRGGNTVFPQVSYIDLSDGDSDTPPPNQQDKSQEGVKLACGQRQNGNVKTLLQGTSDLYLAAGGSETSPMHQQDKSHEGVIHASTQREDRNVKSMLEESSDLDVAPDEGETPPKSQQDKSNEGDEHASRQRQNGNVKIVLQENSDVHLAAGGSDTPPVDRQKKSHEGVDHVSSWSQDGNVMTRLQGNSDLDVAADEVETPRTNNQDNSHEGVEHASSWFEDGNVNTGLQERSDLNVVAGESEIPPVNQQDESHEGVNRASSQHIDGNVNTILHERSDLDAVAADKDNGPVGGQQKAVSAEPRGKKRFREEGKNDESIIADRDRISSLSSVKLAEKKMSCTEQENLNSYPLPCNQEDSSHGLGEQPSCGQKKPLTSGVCNGESKNNGSDIAPCVESMESDNPSDKEVKAQRGNKEEPCVPGLCAGESSCKGTDIPHCVESIREEDRRQASSDHFVNKRRYEGATSTVSTERGSCFEGRQQRFAVRKVPMSRAAKLYGVRC